MQVNTLLEEKLWKITRPNPLDKNELVEIIEYVFKRLSGYLQQPLEVIGQDALSEDSFCRSFRGEIVPNDPFKITYVGLLELGLVGDDFKPHINAWIFLFGEHHRLTAGEPAQTYVEFVYDKIDEKSGNWRSLGWMEDEFGQYEDIEESEFL